MVIHAAPKLETINLRFYSFECKMSFLICKVRICSHTESHYFVTLCGCKCLKAAVKSNGESVVCVSACAGGIIRRACGVRNSIFSVCVCAYYSSNVCVIVNTDVYPTLGRMNWQHYCNIVGMRRGCVCVCGVSGQ